MDSPPSTNEIFVDASNTSGLQNGTSSNPYRLACTRAWGLADDDPRLNPNGGSIAIGHPLGVTGTRIAYSATLELHEQQKRYALVTMCIGVGQGYAAILERV